MKTLKANLISEMAKSHVTVKALADYMQMHRNGISNRLYGRTNFTVDEAIAIQDKFFPGKSVEWLFKESDGLEWK